MKRHFRHLLSPLLVASSLFAAQAPSVRPTALRCEYLTNPLGIDGIKPRLSWELTPLDPKARGLSQSAYRVIAASTEEQLRAGKGDLWDTGKVRSDRSIHVEYAGKPLASGMRVFWKVQAWDQAGNASAWSDSALWTMGLLRAEDWKGKWIGQDEKTLYKSSSSPYRNLEKSRWIWFPAGEPAKSAPAGVRFFRTNFDIPASRVVTKALVIIGADDSYELSLNGKNIGKGTVHMPDVFDITQQVHAGANTVAVKATNARANTSAGLIAALRVEFRSGDPMLITSGQNWQAAERETGNWVSAQDLGAFGMDPWGEVGYKEERVLPGRVLRKEFDLSRKLKRATAYVSGLGLFEFYVNGAKMSDHVLSPGLTEYNKRTLYVTFDVTRQLAAGRNAMGLLLGNGRYWAPRVLVPTGMRSFGYPKAIVQLNLEYEDGSTSSVVSDETWKLTTNGPIRANNEYDGEEYDARMELKGWNRAGFNDSQWRAAQQVSAPAGALVAEMAEPLRVAQTIKPIKVTQIRPGVYIFDMGQNMVGWCRLKVTGPKGTAVTLRHTETLKADGSLYLENLRSARATNIYTLKGGGPEVWEPRFTYHGFRFVEVTGFPGVPTLASIDGRVVHDALPQIADFVTSNKLINQIHHNIFWGVRGNYRSIPTDCPQRDERQGWLGDRSTVSRSESYMFDVAAFYSKWMTDLVDSQRPTGSIPNVAPAYWEMYSDNITWPSTFILVPGMLYDQYGDVRVIQRDYPAMKKWILYMRTFMKDDLMPRDTYGDWCVPPESPTLIHSKDPARKTDGPLLGTAYYYQMLRLMTRYAKLTGNQADIPEFDALAERVQRAFHKKYFNPQTGLYSNGTQTSSILPLSFHMTPEENRKTVFAGLIRKIEQESKGHVGTGLVGAQWLMRTLSDNGRADVAFTIATQKTYPGWGYMIDQGATTIWELWNGNTADPAMNSGNHVMQIGDLGVWLYEYLAGIRPDSDNPGFKHVIIRPYPTGDLTFVKASHKSMYGPIASSWRREGGRFQLDVTIPANATATVYVPAASAEKVTESGQPAAKAKSVKFVRMENGSAVYEVLSGTYSFAAPGVL